MLRELATASDASTKKSTVVVFKVGELRQYREVVGALAANVPMVRAACSSAAARGIDLAPIVITSR
jgi:hypothetical protein